MRTVLAILHAAKMEKQRGKEKGVEENENEVGLISKCIEYMTLPKVSCSVSHLSQWKLQNFVYVMCPCHESL